MALQCSPDLRVPLLIVFSVILTASLSFRASAKNLAQSTFSVILSVSEESGREDEEYFRSFTPPDGFVQDDKYRKLNQDLR